MLVCRNCGFEGIFESHTCPRCHFPRPRDNEEIAKLRLSIEEAERCGNYEGKISLIKELISLGDAYGERELARLYEVGEHLPRDIDKAMEHYRLGAMLLDGECAFRYSRLLSRMNTSLADFWLCFSSELAYTGAYLDTADVYRDAGNLTLEAYYLTLAEEKGNLDARVRLIEKYATNPENEVLSGYAKWYLDKFTFPPINALKLSYKLRSVKPIAPPTVEYDRKSHLNSLLSSAKAYEIYPAVKYLSEELIALSDSDAPFTLAELYIRGQGVEKDIPRAIEIIKESAERKNPEAALALGIFYKQGELVNRDFDLALSYLNSAIEYGRDDAYFHIAEIYHDKDYSKRDIAYAYELYLLADRAGVPLAKEKAEKIAKLREEYFKRALSLEARGEFTKELYKAYGISAVMGYPLGALKLAECYALARGTSKNRREAFRWYKVALERGVKEAKLPIAVCYSRGFGTRFCYDLALYYLSSAIEDGERRAERELSKLLAKRERGVSNKIYSKAARLIYLKKYTLAKSVLNTAYSLGHPRATYLLGCLYEFGRGTATNKTRAYELYREAEALGFTDARAKYKSIILRLVKRL